MNIDISTKESISDFFIKCLGYENNSLYNCDLSLLNLTDSKEVRNIHLITNTHGFTIWLIEVDNLNSDVIRRITTQQYKKNHFAYKLLIFKDKKSIDTTFVFYYKERNDIKLKIRRLNIYKNMLSTTDKQILQSLSIVDDNTIDDVYICNKFKDAFDIEKVSGSFFKEFSEEYKNLQNNIRRHSSNNLDDCQIEFLNSQFSLLLMNRLVFLYFIQKKGWLNGKRDYLYDRFLYCKRNDLNYYKDFLLPLFFNYLDKPVSERKETDNIFYGNIESQTDLKCDKSFWGIPYLNGGLFKKNSLLDFDDIHIANSVFERLFVNLLNKYNFTVREDIGYDSDVAVDPELLGKIFENMMSNKVKSESGTFYTPRPIMNHICKESIKGYLCSNFHKNKHNNIAYLVDNIECEYIYSNLRPVSAGSNTGKVSYIDGTKYILEVQDYQTLLQLLDVIRVCDPAIGSGAFILGMLQLLLQLKSLIKKMIFPQTEINLYNEKMYIIKNNLFGMDIQDDAVTISQLRLWLSLAVEENVTKFSEIQPLPNLEFRICKGNSLERFNKQCELLEYINTEPKVVKIIKSIEKLKREYFSSNISKKVSLTNVHKNIELFKNMLTKRFGQLNSIWEMNFPEVFLSENANDRGFDIIVGNPPYVQAEKTDYYDMLLSQYGYNDDLYSYFTLKSIELLKSNGFLAFMTSNTFLTIDSKLHMRELLLSNSLIELIDTYRILPDIKTNPAIFIVQKGLTPYREFTRFVDAKGIDCSSFLDLLKSPNVEFFDFDITLYKKLHNKPFFKPTNKNISLCNKIYQSTNTLISELFQSKKNKYSIIKDKDKLQKHISSLKEGDITLLGLCCVSGQGIATGDNSKFLAYLSTSDIAKIHKNKRIEKFYDKIIKVEKHSSKFYELFPEYTHIKSKKDVANLFNVLSEKSVELIFEKCKDSLGNNIFGRGYVYRIIEPKDIANFNEFTDSEKISGVSRESNCYIPYDKGFPTTLKELASRDNNGRWFIEPIYYINWSSNSVKSISYKRNCQLWFREGIFWSGIKEIDLKCRLAPGYPYDGGSSEFATINNNIDCLSNKYLLALFNTRFFAEYIKNFVNNTQHYNSGDVLITPIIIPSKDVLTMVEQYVDDIILCKKNQTDFNKERIKMLETMINELIISTYI